MSYLNHVLILGHNYTLLWRQNIFLQLCGTVTEDEDQTAFSFLYGFVANFAKIPIRNKKILNETEAMLSKLATTDFCPLTGMFSNPTLCRDLPHLVS